MAHRIILVITILLLSLGAIMVYSSSSGLAREKYHNPYRFLIRQIMWISLGAVFFFLTYKTTRLGQCPAYFNGLFFPFLYWRCVHKTSYQSFLIVPTRALHSYNDERIPEEETHCFSQSLG